MSGVEAVHRNEFGVTAEWSKQGFWGRTDCVCCGFAMIGENRTLHVRVAKRAGIDLCDGCVNLIAAASDGRIHYASTGANEEVNGNGEVAAATA